MSKPSFLERGSTRKSDDTSVLDYDSCVDDRDDTKRRTRNLSEKKRRDQFNILINELNGMISTNTRKMDKSTVLKSAISFLRNHNDVAKKSRDDEIEGEWKPAFLSNSEFAHLILDAVDGFVIVLSTAGRIVYASDSVTSLLGHLPSHLQNVSIYELSHESDQPHLYNMLHEGENKENGVSVQCHLKSGFLKTSDQKVHELVELHGYFRSDLMDTDNTNSCYTDEPSGGVVFVATGRLLMPLIIRDVSTVDSNKNEFTSRHSLEWKFLFLDHRASPIIGYLPFEVLGTSGYDYYHVDDLDKLVVCHESLMLKGEATSSHYRFLMKGQQWIWLQTRFYVTYHQWNSKPEFIVCTHHVVSFSEMLGAQSASNTPEPSIGLQVNNSRPTALRSCNKTIHYSRLRSQSDTASTDSRQSQLTVRSNRSCTYATLPPPPSAAHYLESHHYVAVPPSLVLPSPSSSPQGHKRPFMIPTLIVTSPQPHRQCLAPALMVTSPQSSLVSTSQSLLPPSLMMASPQPLLTPSLVLSSPQNVTKTHQLQNLSPLVLTSTQSAVQDQLQLKHQQLQQLITVQQAELRRVSKQLMMARCGVMPTDGSSSACPTLSPQPQPTADMFADTMSPLAAVATRADTTVYQHQQVQQYGSDNLMPFELSQQQAQQLFSATNQNNTHGT